MQAALFLMGLQGVWEQNALDKRLIKQYGEREKSTHYNAREDSFKMKKAITLLLSLAVLLSLTAWTHILEEVNSPLEAVL